MAVHWGAIPAGTVIPFPFDTFAGATGASITISGLAVTDIEVYKGTSMTQRSSDAGYALMDTDGIDLDGTTGIQGFSIDTGDNTDAGFYAVGSLFWVVVSAITIDSQTVNFIAGTFRLVAAEGTAGTPSVDVTRISNDATAADNAEAFFDGTGYAGTNNTIPTVTTTGTATAVTTVNGLAANVITATSIAADAITAAKIATGAIDADAIAADAVTEIQSGLATQASVDTIDNFLDTEVAAILAAVDTEVAAILALLDDARTEPAQGNPPVNPDLATKVDYLYAWTRNKKDNNGTVTNFYADDGTTINWKQTTAESGGTVTKGEIATGA